MLVQHTMRHKCINCLNLCIVSALDSAESAAAGKMLHDSKQDGLIDHVLQSSRFGPYAVMPHCLQYMVAVHARASTDVAVWVGAFKHHKFCGYTKNKVFSRVKGTSRHALCLSVRPMLQIIG